MAIQATKYFQQLKAEIQTAAMQFAFALSGMVQKNTPVAFGTLSGSFMPLVQGETEDFVTVAVGSPLWAAYGQYVEFGTKAHTPPIQPLILWVNQKMKYLAIGVEFSTGRALPTRRGTRRTTESQRVRIAYAIQRKIARKGTDAQHYVKRTLDAIGAKYTVTDDEGALVYEVDVTTWLQQNKPRLFDDAKKGTFE